MPQDELLVQAAAWVPLLLTHVAVFLEDRDAGIAAMVQNRALADLLPADLFVALALTVDALCAWTDTDADELKAIAQTYLDSVVNQPTVTPEGGTP